MDLALAPLAVFGLVLLLITLAGFRDSQIRITNLFFLKNFAVSSVTLPVVFALLWVLWPLEGSPNL